MKFPGFVGPTYNLPSKNVDVQRCINLFPEIVESGTGKEGNTVYYKSTPGLVSQFTVGTGPIRLVYPIQLEKFDALMPSNQLLIVSGNKVFVATNTAGTWATAEVTVYESLVPTTLATSTGLISAVGGGLYEDSSGSNLFGKGYSVTFVDGSKLYVYNLRVKSGVLYKEVNAGDPPQMNPTHVVLLDGFYIYNQGTNGQFFVSDWNSPTFVSSLSFASSEGDPDKIVGMLGLNRQLWLFNERTTEIWANTGNADFPFERIQGGFVEKGCLAGGSIAKADGIAFWLGRDISGQGQVYAASSINPQRISTHAVEYAISTYANPENARGYTYSANGHTYYMLCFDEATWCYDLSTKMWHERAYTNAGVLERHRGIVAGFFPEIGKQMIGDHTTGKVYVFDDQVYTDDGNTITRRRVSPHISGGLKRVFYHKFTLDMETGVGLDGNVQGSDPQVMMRFSSDGGHTWSSEAWVSAGKKIGGIGDFKKRLIWNGLGSAYDRVFEITITDPVPVTILGAELELEVGAS